jgi:N-methylhydantoinase B/oxoprolinase/acetone carboxylase alpha subunit
MNVSIKPVSLHPDPTPLHPDPTPLKSALARRRSAFAKTGVYLEHYRHKDSDLIKFEVFYTKLSQYINNARELAKQVAASPEMREMGESVLGLYTPEGDAICLSPGLMVHVRTMSRAIKWMIDNDYETEVGIRPGDIFFNNDPYIGGGHAPDQQVIIPLFRGDRLIGWAGGMSHVSEVGAVEPGGMGISMKTRFHEGLYLPCTKIGENDLLRKDIEILIDRSVRASVWWLLDTRAKLAGVKLIRDAVNALIAEYGEQYFLEVGEEYIEDTRRATVDKMKRVLYPGRYRDVGWRGVDQPELRTYLHAPIETTIRADGTIFIDADGMSSAGQHPVQATLPLFEGILFNSLIQHVFYDTRYNEGTAMVLNYHVPEGSACNPPDIYHATALWGPAFAGGIACNQSVSRAYYANGYLEEVHASNAQVNAVISGGIDLFGRKFAGWNMEMCASGAFATAFMDGLDTAIAEFNAEGDSGDAEIWETALPLTYLGRSIRIDGGGPGRFRGGAGLYSTYMTPDVPALELGSFGGAPIFTAPGLMGGYPAPVPTVYVVRNTDMRERIARQLPLPNAQGDPEAPNALAMVNGTLEVAKGGNYIARPIEPYCVYVQPGGDGSGFGDVLLRDPNGVKRDLDNGVISMRMAREVYGVVLDAAGEVDTAATREKRAGMRKDRLARAIPARAYRDRVRAQILAGDLPQIAKDLYKDILRKPGRFKDDYLAFWELSADFSVR